MGEFRDGNKGAASFADHGNRVSFRSIKNQRVEIEV